MEVWTEALRRGLSWVIFACKSEYQVKMLGFLQISLGLKTGPRNIFHIITSLIFELNAFLLHHVVLCVKHCPTFIQNSTQKKCHNELLRLGSKK